jgi:anti-anti-sigma factor
MKRSLEREKPDTTVDLLRFSFGQNETTETLSVSGELDVSGVAAFECAVAAALDGQGGEFHLDLSGLTFMDSTGAQALLRVHKRIDGIGRSLVIMHPTRAVRLVIELLGIDEIIRVQA